MALIDFKPLARYFPASIRSAWGAFIDELISGYESAPEDNSSYTNEPTGFVSPEKSVISFDNITRTFTIDLVTPSVPYEYLLDNKLVSVSSLKSVVSANTEGLQHFYFDSSGDLLTSDSVKIEELLRDNVYIANVYWSLTDDNAIIRGDERHLLMPWQTHIWLHDNEGTQHSGGLTFGDILADQSGSLDSHVQFSVASGSILDEDITLSIAGKSAGFDIPVYSKTGAGPSWTISAVDDAPIVISIGVPQINSYVLGSWGQVPVTNNKYYLAHIFASNDWRPENKIICIQGENEYNSVSDARVGANNEISDLITTGLPMQEFLPLGTFIIEYKSVYTNSYSSRFRTTAAGDDYVSWIGAEITPGSTPSAHPNLTNRDYPNQHPDSSVDLSATGTGFLLSSTILSEAMAVLDGFKTVMAFAKTGKLYWGNNADTANLLAIEKNTSDVLIIGEGMTNVIVDNDLEITGDAKATTVEIDKVLRNINSKVLTDAAWGSVFKWVPTTDGDYMSFICRIVAHVEYTFLTVTHHYVHSQVMHGNMVRNDSGATGIKITTVNNTPIITNTGAGTFTVAFSLGATGHGTNGVGPAFRVTINTGSWVSGSITLHTEILDENSREII